MVLEANISAWLRLFKSYFVKFFKLANRILAVYFKTSQRVRPSVCSDLVLRFSPPFMSAATLRERYTGFLAMKKIAGNPIFTDFYEPWTIVKETVSHLKTI